MHNSDYTPLSCSMYDVLEASAVKNSVVRLEVITDSGLLVREVKILDLFSKDKAEFLKANDGATNEEFTLRLDAIRLITDVATGNIYSPNAC